VTRSTAPQVAFAWQTRASSARRCAADNDSSDLDLLVDALPGATLFDLGGLQDELEQLLGVPVDLVTPRDLPARFRDTVLSEARPV